MGASLERSTLHYVRLPPNDCPDLGENANICRIVNIDVVSIRSRNQWAGAIINRGESTGLYSMAFLLAYLAIFQCMAVVSLLVAIDKLVPVPLHQCGKQFSFGSNISSRCPPHVKK
eukprot:jgi/Mesvir1/29134/Mv24049-RA.1